MKNGLRVLVTVVAVLTALTVALGTPRAAHAATPCTGGCPYDLGPGGILYGSNGDYVYNGPLKLVMQGDGNLVLYYNSTPIWATGTNNWADDATYEAILQTDGNFVVYCYYGLYDRCGNGTAIWASGTNGLAIDHLFVGFDPNTPAPVYDDFLLLDPGNQVELMSANTSCSGSARSNGPMAGPGSGFYCYPQTFNYPSENGLSPSYDDE